LSKKRFIQQVIIRSLPTVDKLPQAIGYAENLWDALSKASYGEKPQAQPRANKDWYNSLSATQKQHFDKFWQAFRYKHGRDGAAMRWAQLGELDQASYKNIIKAAEAEALRQLPQGQSRIMAQGWLNEKRWQDYQAPKHDNKKQQNKHINQLIGELTGLKTLYNQSRSEALAPQIEKLEKALENARKQTIP